MSMRTPTETALVKTCLDHLRLRGVLAWRNNTAGIRRVDRRGRAFWSFHGLRGAADILGVLPGGRFLAVEVKRPGNHPTEAQRAFLDGVRDAGGAALCVHSVEELVVQLQREMGL